MKPVEYTLEKLKQHRKELVAALRSGEYKQTYGILKNTEGYCCLGVACEVSGCTSVPRQQSSNYEYTLFVGDVSGDESAGVMTGQAQRYFGFTTATGHYGEADLMKHNDRDNWTFEQIADLIESEPEGMFISV